MLSPNHMHLCRITTFFIYFTSYILHDTPLCVIFKRFFSEQRIIATLFSIFMWLPMLFHTNCLHWHVNSFIQYSLHAFNGLGTMYGGYNKSTVDIMDPEAIESLLMPQMPHYWGVLGSRGLILSTFLLTGCIYHPTTQIYSFVLCHFMYKVGERCVSFLQVTCFFYVVLQFLFVLESQ